MESFGERLRDSMLIAGIDERRVAKDRGVSIKTVRNWLEMVEPTLSGAHLARLGMLLGVSIRWLALGIGTPVPIGMAEARKELAMI